MFTSTYYTGDPALKTLWFRIDSIGTLLEISSGDPGLARTGFDPNATSQIALAALSNFPLMPVMMSLSSLNWCRLQLTNRQTKVPETTREFCRAKPPVRGRNAGQTMTPSWETVQSGKMNPASVVVRFKRFMTTSPSKSRKSFVPGTLP